MREWIVTNGIGGYASLTHLNTNTSKYHGLLVASLNPPKNRWVFITNVEDKIQIDNNIFQLNNIKGNFTYELFPSVNYKLDGLKIKKLVFMPHGKNLSIIKYNINTDREITLIHTPIINSRHFYDLSNYNAFKIRQDISENEVNIYPSNIEKILKIKLFNSKYKTSECWREFHYVKDKERNDSYIDYNLYIGNFYKKIRKTTEYYLVFSLENKINKNLQSLYLDEIQRKKDLLNQANLSKAFDKLVLAADNFIVSNKSDKSMIAGYHWFGEWGRDTLISIPGLTLVTGKFDIAKCILFNLKKYCRNGLIPNVIMDKNSEASYNSVDTSLWFIDRVFQYLKYTNDRIFLNEIWNTLDMIIESYKNGTDHGIYMEEDFLIGHNSGLTWMDVKIGDYYPTPRARKSVEIQALWYNALRIMSKLATILEKDDKYYNLSENVKKSFNLQYDNRYDVIDNMDLSIRPNQIFLVSLDFNMITKDLKEKIVKEVQNNLVTIFGLRTLSPDDSNYKGSYIGDYNRDIAYHNGTVWPWLIGPFIKSFVKLNNHESSKRKFAFEHFLKPMIHVFGSNWDGSIYEIFDGDPPYIPRGCISQAWSVAELLRSWVEDIENISPIYENMFISHEICI